MHKSDYCFPFNNSKLTFHTEMASLRSSCIQLISVGNNTHLDTQIVQLDNDICKLTAGN